MTPGTYLHLDNNTLRIEVEHETKLRVPLHHISSVVLFGDILVSPAAMHELADQGKTLVLLDRNGRFKARLEGAVSGNVLLRQAQFRRLDDSAFVLDTAKSIVAGKLRNSRQLILRSARETSDAEESKVLSLVAQSLAASLRGLDATISLDQVRGIEGEAAKNYFDAFKYMVKKSARDQFTMNGRNRRPPRDRINALLSFLYSMVMNDCRSAIESVGLDSQAGFLHALRPGRAALALDLMEEFRSIVADRLVLALINLGQIKENDFEERPGETFQLVGEARKTVVVAYQNKKQEEINHPLLEGKVPIGLIPQLQARLLARVVRGEIDGYLPYLVR